jgi:hypothetical protein
MDIAIEDLILAAIIVIVMIIGMRVIYGYWPWQRRPVNGKVMQQEVVAAFRESPPYKPFSEVDVADSPDVKP